MTLSSTVIIHNTSSKESLKKILRFGFKPFYCRETIFSKSDSGEAMIPMVSFSDIPLSQIKSQIEKYGSYGIGLAKEWACNNMLNPVIYMNRESYLIHSYGLAYSHFCNAGNTQEWSKEQKALADIFRYTKNYEGPLIRKGITENDAYRFADEREWRFVPSYDTECEMIVHPLDYQDRKKQIDKEIDHIRLIVEPKDIKYLIIDNESEIMEFIAHIKSTFAKNSEHEIDKLITRIITKEQIINDI